MKSVRLYFLSSIICILALVVSGCTTIACSNARKVGDKTIEIDVTQSAAAGNILNGAIRGLGGKLGSFIKLPSPALDKYASAAKDGVLTDAETAALERLAIPEAEAHIRKNSQLFCNECKDGEPCAAKAHGIKLQFVGSRLISSRGGVKVIRLTFKILEVTIACGPCLECRGVVAAADVGNHPADVLLVDASDGDSCDGEPQVVVEGEPFEAEFVAELLGEEILSEQLAE